MAPDIEWEQHLGRIEQDARDLIEFANGVEEAGMVSYAQKARNTARDALELAREVRLERRCRLAMQAQRDDARRLFLERCSS